MLDTENLENRGKTGLQLLQRAQNARGYQKMTEYGESQTRGRSDSNHRTQEFSISPIGTVLWRE